MPMIVDPAAPHITPPERITSPDGWFAAVVDELWAGVVLSYNGATPPTVRNLVRNPSAELTLTTATTGYGTNNTRSRVNTEAQLGAYSFQHAISTAAAAGGTSWEIEPVSGEQTVQAGVWVKIPASGVAGLELWWRNGTTNLHTVAVLAQATPGTWQRVTGAYTLAPGETCDRIAAVATAGAGPVTWWADAAMAEVGDTLHDYVDGSRPGGAWEGAAHASASVLLSSVPQVDDVRKVRIVRQDPGAEPVPVRSGDAAWAIEGVGTAYDAEAPLGVSVVYTATPIYADGSTGTSSSLAVTVPAPEPGEDRDLWVKSLDEPGLSLRVMVVDWSGASSTARQDTADIAGSPYKAVAYDEHAAEAVQVVVDVPPEDVDRMRELLRSGVLLAQARPGYYFPDAFHVPGDITGPTPTGKLGSSEGYRFGWTIEPTERPSTIEQPMRLPAWSWDTLAEQFGTWDAVAASYSTWASLSTNGVV
ncbi:hypothetical protein AB0M00_19425 [Streptomyces chartreusis]|uniref:hypothetical protein n=1 Tax=Streptomyces chartreusis TaxID=1969 RepID=UPI00342D4D94